MALDHYFVVVPEGTPDINGSTIGRNGIIKSENGKIKIAYAQILPPNGNGASIEIHGRIKKREGHSGKYPRYSVTHFDEKEMEQNQPYLEKLLRDRGIEGRLVRA